MILVVVDDGHDWGGRPVRSELGRRRWTPAGRRRLLRRRLPETQRHLLISESFGESDPVQLPVVLAHDAGGDSCEAWLTASHSFNLALWSGPATDSSTDPGRGRSSCESGACPATAWCPSSPASPPGRANRRAARDVKPYRSAAPVRRSQTADRPPIRYCHAATCPESCGPSACGVTAALVAFTLDWYRTTGNHEQSPYRPRDH